MTNNTILNVSRELLERVKSLCEYWFVRGQQQHMSESEYKTWHALGFGSSAFTELRALLSAPSPAGVGGWDVAGDILEKLSAAQAIIDGLRGEVGAQRVKTCTALKERNDARAERDQRAQRIGELEGLLNRTQVSLSLDDTEWGYSAPEKYKLLADIRAALSAGKVG